MSNHARILVVDGDPAHQTLVQFGLQRAGYIVQVAETGQAALALYPTSDLVLLDSQLPDMDGFTVCVELRKRSYVPIVMLSASTRVEDIIKGFSAGVDDFITKPYRENELAVRLQAVLRRSMWHTLQSANQHILAVPDLLLNDILHEVWVRGALVSLTPSEYRLLRHLMSHPDQTFSKNELCQFIGRQLLHVATNHVEVAIRRLRQKIEVDPSRPLFVHTLRGSGYVFKLPRHAAQAITDQSSAQKI